MNPILAIDQGANGGMAFIDAYGIVSCWPMPSTMPDIAESIREYYQSTLVVYIEKVGTYVPGNSGPAAAKFARHCGHIEAILYSLGLPTKEVTANKWMKAIGTWPKDKAQRKRAIKEAMQKRYARCKVTLATSDALGILTYAIQQESQL